MMKQILKSSVNNFKSFNYVLVISGIFFKKIQPSRWKTVEMIFGSGSWEKLEDLTGVYLKTFGNPKVDI